MVGENKVDRQVRLFHFPCGKGMVSECQNNHQGGIGGRRNREG